MVRRPRPADAVPLEVPVTLTLLPASPVATVVAESRPVALRWTSGALDQHNPAQPGLDLLPGGDAGVTVDAPGRAGAVEPGMADARAWSVALAVLVVEVLTGRRPVGQLSRWLSEAALAAVPAPRPLRPAPAGAPRAAPAPATLRSVRVQHPAPGVAEVTVHARLGDRSLPLALRLEGQGSRWSCTALELGPARDRVQGAAGSRTPAVRPGE